MGVDKQTLRAMDGSAELQGRMNARLRLTPIRCSPMLSLSIFLSRMVLKVKKANIAAMLAF
ncbi:hypothetical protein [Vibrio ziniensis]|uniref:Uncharacterized protein n=1 Tax=Vibrio ziniensis TaxID=2711221 RepID=A0A6G7CL16_9VIBR|nr:hypothetical protein [Vibrio ziniensis]QIH42792.1 hypothetical protein G5S32_12710 [Vibrio ziniensis]